LLLVKALFPVTVLRIAATERKDGVGQTISTPLPRADANQQGTVTAAFDAPGVASEEIPGGRYEHL
jgi:hypothetical protein